MRFLELALRGLLGEGAPLSAGSLMRLKGAWQGEYAAWKRADLSQLELVYWWADGLYVKAELCDRKAALLAIVGASSRGEKVLVACEAGERESKESWCELLRDLQRRGLRFPRLTVADGHLGMWAALGELPDAVFCGGHPPTRPRACRSWPETCDASWKQPPTPARASAPAQAA